MANPNKTATQVGAAINGFLRRWRRNASRAGAVTTAVVVAVGAAAIFVLTACKSLFK
jgi:hypothetical protein